MVLISVTNTSKKGMEMVMVSTYFINWIDFWLHGCLLIAIVVQTALLPGLLQRETSKRAKRISI